MKQLPIVTSFNGGELSPSIAGRVDVAKFGNGAERMQNFIPTVQGPAISRPGFRFVAEVKNSAQRTWLVRFEFSATEAWQLEFGDGYVRFYTNRARVIVSGVVAWATATAYALGDLRSEGGVNYYCKAAHTSGTFATDLAAGRWHALTGNVYEVPSPYTAAALTNADGSFALRYVQSGDVIRLVGAGLPPQKLSRFGPTNWTLQPVDFQNGPFADDNATATTIYASAETGSVTLTASAGIFTAAQVGRLIRLDAPETASDPRWEASKSLAGVGVNVLNLIRRAGGNVYRCATNYAAATKSTHTGTIMPTHTEGIEADGDGGAIDTVADRAGVDWEYLHSGFGIVRITGYTSATQVTAEVLSRLPARVVGAGNPTKRWAWGAWDAERGYPTCVTFFRERCVYARDASLWFSVVSDFDNFADKIGGQVTADAGFDRTIASDRLNAIKWLSPGNVLLVGTLGDEFAISEQSASSAFSPSNVKTERQSVYGSGSVDAVRVGDTVMFLQRAGKRLRSIVFSNEQGGYRSDDLTAFADHITQAGVVDMAFQQEPWTTLWCARADGVLAALTFNVEQNVVAWHRHPLSDGVCESVEVIPAPSGTRDDLWVIVRYTINGTTRRYIAYLADEETELMAQADWFYVDMGLTYSGAPATTISGLSHLEGKEVWILADGAWHPPRTVSGGQITLQQAASKAQIGLPSVGLIETSQLSSGDNSGTSQGKTKRVHLMVLRVLRSLGGRAGPSEAKLREMQYRLPSVPMGSAPPAFTGDIDVEWDGDYGYKQTIVVQRNKPMPLTIVAAMPQLYAQEGR